MCVEPTINEYESVENDPHTGYLQEKALKK